MSSPFDALAPLAILFPGVYVALYLAALAHEGGHAVFGALCGYRITSLGMGTARPLFVWRLPGGTRFYVCRTAPLQGLTWAYLPRAAPAKTRSACFIMGGVFVNAILALLALLPWRGFPPLPLDVALLAQFVWGISNALIAVTNLFPFFLTIDGRNVLRSDGAQLLGLLLTRGRIPAQSARSALGLRPLWEAIADTEMQTSQLLHASGAACALGDNETAKQFLNDAFALPPARGSVLYLRAVACLTAANLAVEQDDYDAVEKWLDGAYQAFMTTGNRAGRAHIAFVRQEVDARRAARADDLPGALRLLEALPNALPFPAHPGTKMNIEALRVRFIADSEDGGAADITAALARFENARRRVRADLTDLATFTAVARGLARRGDTAGAVAQGYEPAFTSAQAVYKSIADAPDEQRAFADQQAPLVADAQAALRSLGRDADADALADALPDPIVAQQEAEREQAEADEKTKAKRAAQVAADRRRFKAGWTITGVNAAIGLLVYAYQKALPAPLPANSRADVVLTSAFVAVLLHVILTLLISGGMLVFGLAVSAWRRANLPGENNAAADGWVVLSLAVSTYVTFAALLFALLPGR